MEEKLEITKKSQYFFYGIFSILLIVIWYSNWLLHPYIYPPGTDPAVHLQIMHQVEQGQFYNYPVFFHLTALILQQITGVSVNTILIFFPLFIFGVIIPLLIFAIIRRIVGFRWAVYSLPIILAIPFRILEMNLHGQLPETMAIGINLTLVYLYIRKKYFFVALLCLPLFLTHHLTSIPFFMAVVAVTVYHSILNFKRNKLAIIIWPIFLALILSCVTYLWKYYNGVFQLYSQYFLDWLTQGNARGINDIVPWSQIFSIWVGNPVFYALGGLSVFLLCYFVFRKKSKALLGSLTLICAWWLALLLLSRVPFEPYFSIRIWRQAVFPTLIMAALTWAWLQQYIKNYYRIIFSGLLIVLISSRLLYEWNNYYAPQKWTVLKPLDQSAITYIQENIPAGSTILMNMNYERWLSTLLPQKIVYYGFAYHNLDDTGMQFWEVLNNTPQAQSVISQYNIRYIYATGDVAGVPHEDNAFNVKALVKSGLWKVIYSNERVQILAYTK